MLKASAHQKLATMKCGPTSHEHSSTISALMTKVNNPKVTRLIGSASSFTNGRINALIKPNRIAIITAHHQGSTVTPSSVNAVINTANPEIINLVTIVLYLI